jgi:predicted O-linked N-acetylglucosamine transferase (SPINDLY family)
VPQTPDYPQWIERIWNQQVALPQLLAYAETLAERPALVATLYHAWLQRNAGPQGAIAAFNLGVVLATANDLPGAVAAYQQALVLNPTLAPARINLGLTQERQGLLDAAVEQWQYVADQNGAANSEANGLRITALNHIGRLQENRKLYLPASQALERSLGLNPEQPDAIHHLVFQRQRQCAWPIYAPVGDVSAEALRAGTSALAMINISDDPQAQLDAALSYARRKVTADLPRLSPAQGYRHDRLRIAYCSGDFCTHPVAMLTVELFEHHDKAAVEVFAFCWSPNDGGPLRQRILNAVEHYVPVHDKSDDEIAALIRAYEIDILIDLQGQTSGAKTRMLAQRPAPIQITYLGLPATTGLPGIDYVIADRYLIPEEQARYYSEKPLYMPDVYQVSDRKREHSSAPTRKACGLPARKLVFCSFNNNHKYTLEVFSTWMNILRRVPNSVLWLLADNPWAADNLRQQAKVQGIDPKRLVFAERASPADYLARYLLADLFLDTFPFNAGTTANDALWMGLPVLTMSGRSFASRMAGALLTAAQLPELITEDLHAYEELAVALAGDAKKRQRLCEKLAQAKASGPLFDSLGFTRALEQQYQTLATNLAAQTSPGVLDDIVAITAQAEVFQAQGDEQGAIQIYRQWLNSRSSVHDWMIQFNLAILLKDTGAHQAARNAFVQTLQQRPDFTPAVIALQQLK